MLEDLDFTNDLVLLSHTHQDMQKKTCHLSKCGKQVRLQISKRKTEVMTLNVTAPAPVWHDDQPFPVKRPSPMWAALSDRMKVPMRTFRAGLAKPGTPSHWSRGHHSTVSRLSWSSSRAACCWPFCIVQSAGRYWAWPCQVVNLSHDKPQGNPTHILAKNRL